MTHSRPVMSPDLGCDNFKALDGGCHGLALPWLYYAALACPFGKQANLLLKYLATLSENMGHWGSWLPTNQASLLLTLEALRTLIPSRPSIHTHKFEGNTKFINRNAHIKFCEQNVQKNLWRAKDKNGRGQPILLMYTTLHRYDDVKGRLQVTHPKISHA